MQVGRYTSIISVKFLKVDLNLKTILGNIKFPEGFFYEHMPGLKQLRMSMIILEGEKENIYLEIMTFMNLLKQLVMIHFLLIVEKNSQEKLKSDIVVLKADPVSIVGNIVNLTGLHIRCNHNGYNIQAQ